MLRVMDTQGALPQVSEGVEDSESPPPKKKPKAKKQAKPAEPKAEKVRVPSARWCHRRG